MKHRRQTKLHFRPLPALVAAIAAGLFVLFRVGYRLLFGGVVLGANYLPTLPRFVLPEPFDHISLFGPVTLDGLAATVLNALPFASVILILGLVVAVLDPARFLKMLNTKKSPGLVKALALALALIPKIISQAKSVVYSAKLRNNKKKSSLIVPILGSALERANNLATRLDLNQKYSESHSEGLCIEIQELAVSSIHYGSFRFQGPGLYQITGPNGSGKSTLLRSIAQLEQSENREITGGVEISAPRGARLFGYLPQDVRLSMIGETIGDEVEFADLELGDWDSSKPLETLSEGELKRFALELELAKRSEILLLDEPFSGLDAVESKMLTKKISEASKHKLVIVTQPQEISALPGTVVQLGELGLRNGGYQYSSPRFETSRPKPKEESAVSVTNLNKELSGRHILRDVSLDVNAGSIVAITGLNGAGKTTLLKELSGPKALLVPENFQDFFVRETLEKELSYSDSLAGCTIGLTKATFFSLMNGAENQPVESLMQTHPRDLSFATGLALAMAIQIANRPRVLLVDEPARGFDPVAKAATRFALNCVAEVGTAVIFATHDMEFADFADRKFELLDARLCEVRIENSAR